MIKLPHYLKLFWAELVEECNRNTHHAIIICGNGICVRHINGIVIVISTIANFANILMLRIADVIIHRHQLKWLVATSVVDIREPKTVVRSNNPISILVDSCFSAVKFIACGNDETRNPTPHAMTKPCTTVHDKREHLFVFNAVDIPDDKEQLLRFQNPCEELAEERERRIGDDNVCLVAELTDLLAAKIAIALQIPPFEIIKIDAPVGGRVVVENEDLAAHLGLRLVERRLLGLVERGLIEGLDLLARRRIAGRDQFLQSKALEVLGEEAGELAPLGVVAGQKHRLAAKRVGIEVEIGVDLLLDVIILRIELIVLRILRLGQQPVLTHQLLSVRFLTQYIKLPRKRS